MSAIALLTHFSPCKGFSTPSASRSTTSRSMASRSSKAVRPEEYSTEHVHGGGGSGGGRGGGTEGGRKGEGGECLDVNDRDVIK